jgi:putative addiction module killer protein
MRIYITPEFGRWLADLRDRRARVRIQARIDRLSFGSLGDFKQIGGGVGEMRIDYGPGYRLYVLRRGDDWIILLCGGDKGSQSRDIAKAQKLAGELR